MKREKRLLKLNVIDYLVSSDINANFNIACLLSSNFYFNCSPTVPGNTTWPTFALIKTIQW